VKTKLVTIEGKQIGIVGLDEVFEEFSQEERKLDEDLKHDLVKRLRELNYIPASKEEVYASVFLDEYEKFCDRKDGKTEAEKRDLGTWQGIPREEVPWYPAIREELCDGCNICVEFCSFGVYEYDEEANKVKVVNPFNCQVGCSMCALKCKPNAILFPPLTILEAFRKR
jgi:NAD-dependent dihydropyrimidine dehydrogenase PreA subunit